MVLIIPAILATDEKQYSSELSEIEQSGSFEDGWVHIDFMDNIFVQNQSIGPDIVDKYPTKLKIEAHLMVKNFRSLVAELVKIGVKRIILHAESDDLKQIEDELAYLEDRHIENGLAINPETDISKVESAFKDIDVLLIMSIHPGFQGQEFMPEALEKIKQASLFKDENNLSFKIEVDGGVDQDNAKQLVEAGVDGLVVGSHLLKGNIEENLEKIWEKLS